MPASRYKVLAVGAQLGATASAPFYVHLQSVAKKAATAYPFVVANEFICNQFAKILVLPSPPGAIVEVNSQPCYVSLDFNLSGHALPPANPADVASEHPRLSWGISIFDIFVMNSDRHAGNISYDTTTKKVQIFDHSHALVGLSPDIPGLIARNENALGIGGHCLAREISSPDGQVEWIGRLKSMPDYFVADIVHASVELGFPAGEASSFIDFLRRRRDKIDTLLQNNRASFPRLPTTH